MAAYHRIIWFHNRAAAGTYPNARALAEQFEISPRQAQRDIEYLRDSMNAPLVYCAKERGYMYEGDYTLPSVFLTESERATMDAMIETYRKIGSFGYSAYRDRADLLEKFTPAPSPVSPLRPKEPYAADVEFLDARTSTGALDGFVCRQKEERTVSYMFYDPTVFVSVLLASGLKFRIVRPKWLREQLRTRLEEILSTL